MLYLIIFIVIFGVSAAVTLFVLTGLRPLNPNPNSLGGNFYVKPAHYTLAPGEMIAVLLAIENNDPDGRDLYYSFGIEAFQTDTSEALGEVTEWANFNEDEVFIQHAGGGFKDTVVSVPSDAEEGEYIFKAYSCYSQASQGAAACGKNSQNLWSDPLFLAITVTG